MVGARGLTAGRAISTQASRTVARWINEHGVVAANAGTHKPREPFGAGALARMHGSHAPLRQLGAASRLMARWINEGPCRVGNGAPRCSLVGRAFARAVSTARTQRRRWWARAAFGVALPTLRQHRLRQRALPEFEIFGALRIWRRSAVAS